MNFRKMTDEELRFWAYSAMCGKDRERARAELWRRKWQKLEEEARLRGESAVTLYTRP